MNEKITDIIILKIDLTNKMLESISEQLKMINKYLRYMSEKTPKE